MSGKVKVIVQLTDDSGAYGESGWENVVDVSSHFLFLEFLEKEARAMFTSSLYGAIEQLIKDRIKRQLCL